MSYTPSLFTAPIPSPHPTPSYYSSTPPAPPPRPSASNNQGPPLPPLPPQQNEPLELDGGQGSHYQYQYQNPQQQQAQNQAEYIPPIESNWVPPTLHTKNTADLHALLDDHTLQTAFLTNPDTTHPSLPASEQILRQHLETNIALSTSLSQLASRLSTQRAATQSRLLSLRALEQSHRSKLSETEDALSQFSPMALYQRLSASVAEQDNLVRGVEESWLDESGVADNAEVEAFVRRVKEARKVAFLRRERKGRWDEGRVGGWR